MADFKQLALEFVLTDDQASQTRIAGQAAERTCIRNYPHDDTLSHSHSAQVFAEQQPTCCEVGGVHPAVDAGQRGHGYARCGGERLKGGYNSTRKG